MKKALIHDWYYTNGGAEKVIHSLNNVWNDFEHYALIDFLNEKDRKYILNGKNANTSFIQNLPTAKKNHRKFLHLFPYAIEQFDLNDYDLVLSSSSSISKGVLTTQNQLHICYCHSPMRYAWDLYHQYLKESGLNNGLKSIYAKFVLHKLRNWDINSLNRVDFFIANSKYIQKRIKKVYNRESTVIYPPVDTAKFVLETNKQDFYFTASRMVPYKKVGLIVEAFNKMPNKKLIVAGIGPDFKNIEKIAQNNITVLGFITDSEMIEYMQKAKAFVFAAEEDFGIVPVEAQACGTPVIGYAKGGILETVKHELTGIHFKHQSVNSIIEATNYFETQNFNPQLIHQYAQTFSKERFEKEIKQFVENKYAHFKDSK